MGEEIRAFLRIEKLVKGKIEGYEEWDEIPLGTSVILIGRPSARHDVIQPDIKIIGDDYISRNQAEIFYSFDKDIYMIRDIGSLNQTYLNAEMLEKNKDYTLKDHDLIGLSKIGKEIRVIFRFRISEATLPSWVEEQSVRPSTLEGLSINVAARRVSVAGKEVPLTKKEFKILEVLYYKKGEACQIDELAWEVWGQGGASDELVAKYISRLREKLEPDSSKPRYIITVPGRHGCYRFDL